MLKKIAGVLIAVAPVSAFATAADTTWVTTGLTQAQTDITAYVLAAAPYLFGILVLVVAFTLIFKMFRRAAK